MGATAAAAVAGATVVARPPAAARLRRPRSIDWLPRARVPAVRPSPRPQRVLDPRRRVPDRPARGPCRRPGDARGGAHRPRLDGGCRRAHAHRRQGRREAHPGLRDVRGRRPRDPRPEGAPRPPHPARRDDDGVPQPRAARLGRLPGRLLVPAPGRPRAAGGALRGHHRALGLPLRPRVQGARRGERRPRPQRARTARRHLRARPRLRRAAGRRDRHPDADQPAPGRPRHRREAAARRHRRRPLPDGRRRHPARGAPLHPDERHARQPEPVPVLEPRLLPEEPRGDVRADGAAVGRGHAAPHRRDRRALQRRDRPRHPAPAEVRRPRRQDGARLPARAGRGRPARALRRRDPGAAPPARVRAEDHRGDGLPRLLPDRLGLHPLRPRRRRVGRPGPRLRRRLARRLLPAHHRPRPDALLAPLRALPEPGPQVAPGRRRRLRRGRPRAGHQLRGREVRAPQRRPDHHVRQDAAQGGDQGRRPGDGHPLRRRRPDREARARGAQDHLRGVHEAGRGAAPLVRQRGDDEEDRRHGAAARGRRPQRLDPRRGRRDRRPAPDRVPAAAAEGDRLRGRDAVLDGRRRGARPAQDGLPGPAQPGRDRPRHRGHRAVHRRPPGHGRAAARRPQDLRDDGPRRGDRRVPVRVVRHARRPAPGEADRVRGPDRPERALPAGADAVHPRLCPQQGRPEPGEVRGRAPAAPAREHPRDLHLPGAVHGDRQGGGRVHAPPRRTICARRSARRWRR